LNRCRLHKTKKHKHTLHQEIHLCTFQLLFYFLHHTIRFPYNIHSYHNKSLLIGKKLKKYFAGFGGAIGTVTDYLLDHDAYRLEYSDGHVDIIPFDDILKLLPKSWSKPRDSSTEEALYMVDEPRLEEALIVHVEAAALIAHITMIVLPSLHNP